jgi:hypothetical protein
MLHYRTNDSLPAFRFNVSPAKGFVTTLRAFAAMIYKTFWSTMQQKNYSLDNFILISTRSNAADECTT